VRAPGKDGKSAREHYEGAIERARKAYGEWSREFEQAVRELDTIRGPLWDESLDYLVRIFWAIRIGAGEAVSGVRITWPDVTAWESRNYRLDDDETRAIFAMDAAYRSPETASG
jgi:hypothetical protein